MRTAIATFVGALIVFIWQFLSWGLLEFHRSAQEYTPKQDQILEFLNQQFSEDGAYFLPNLPKGASQEEYEAYSNETMNKPWVQIYYHKSMNMSMPMNMARGFAVDLVLVFLMVWILGKMPDSNIVTSVLVCLGVGMIGFLYHPYTNHIWFQTFDLNAHLLDGTIPWILLGGWLGWFLNRK